MKKFYRHLSAIAIDPSIPRRDSALRKASSFLETTGYLLIISLFLFLCSCSSTLATTSELQQGKRYFEAGYYKSAMHDLLPLATNGNAEAQYAVGYMYYYGYGVSQDTDVGHFWIKRAADQNFKPAIQALAMIDKDKLRK